MAMNPNANFYTPIDPAVPAWRPRPRPTAPKTVTGAALRHRFDWSADQLTVALGLGLEGLSQRQLKDTARHGHPTVAKVWSDLEIDRWAEQIRALKL